jgi:hypothetical protein
MSDRLFYYNRQSRPIYLVNNKPINYSKGGLVAYDKTHKKYINPDDNNEDTIYTELEEGSVVIPVPIVKKGHIDDYIKIGGKISDGKVIKDKTKLVKTILMPGEIVVQKKYAKRVLDFLKNRGITLPINEEEFSP